MDLISIWAVVRWLHLLAAMVWVGGMIFMFIVLLPALRPVQPPVERTLLFARIGQRYATVSWVALLTLIVTGILNGERRRLDWLHLLDSEYGQTLHLKLELVGVTLLLTAVHAFYFGRRLTAIAERARAMGEDSAEAAEGHRKLQIMSGVLSAANLLVNLFIVLLAASLIA